MKDAYGARPAVQRDPYGGKPPPAGYGYTGGGSKPHTPGVHVCPHCSQVCKSAFGLQGHMRVHKR